MSSIQDKFQHRRRFCKVALLGDGAVGKTALRERYLGKGFSGRYTMTIGADFAIQSQIIGDEEILFQIWDLAGQPRFAAIRNVYYSGTNGALLIYDITRRESFENLRIWLKELWKNNERGKVPFVILGNKSDLRNNQALIQVNREYASEAVAKLNEQMQQESGFKVTHFETSAKTGENVREAFEKLGVEMIKFMKRKV